LVTDGYRPCLLPCALIHNGHPLTWVMMHAHTLKNETSERARLQKLPRISGVTTRKYSE